MRKYIYKYTHIFERKQGKGGWKGRNKRHFKNTKINKLRKVFLKMDQRCSLVVALFASRCKALDPNPSTAKTSKQAKTQNNIKILLYPTSNQLKKQNKAIILPFFLKKKTFCFPFFCCCFVFKEICPIMLSMPLTPGLKLVSYFSFLRIWD